MSVFSVRVPYFSEIGNLLFCKSYTFFPSSFYQWNFISEPPMIWYTDSLSAYMYTHAHRHTHTHTSKCILSYEPNGIEYLSISSCRSTWMVIGDNKSRIDSRWINCTNTIVNDAFPAKFFKFVWLGDMNKEYWIMTIMMMMMICFGKILQNNDHNTKYGLLLLQTFISINFLCFMYCFHTLGDVFTVYWL